MRNYSIRFLKRAIFYIHCVSSFRPTTGYEVAGTKCKQTFSNRNGKPSRKIFLKVR